VAYAGARHLVLAAGSRQRLADLDYDFDALRAVMRRLEWTTLALIWRSSESRYHVRNPFPVAEWSKTPPPERQPQPLAVTYAA
jgi:hypothetical protein